MEGINSRCVRVATTVIPTRHGTFRAFAYRSSSGTEHVALIAGDVVSSFSPLVRVHSECVTGESFGSLRCDCGPQLNRALALISDQRCGAVIYLRGHEGRGIGIAAKLQAYGLQDAGLDTVEANVELGLPVDSRDYSDAAAILVDLGIERLRLLSNNPAKSSALSAAGISVAERISYTTTIATECVSYLRTKRDRMGHDFPSGLKVQTLAGAL